MPRPLSVIRNLISIDLSLVIIWKTLPTWGKDLQRSRFFIQHFVTLLTPRVGCHNCGDAGCLLLISLVISFWRLIPLGIPCVSLEFNDFLSLKALCAGDKILHKVLVCLILQHAYLIKLRYPTHQGSTDEALLFSCHRLPPGPQTAHGVTCSSSDFLTLLEKEHTSIYISVREICLLMHIQLKVKPWLPVRPEIYLEIKPMFM